MDFFKNVIAKILGLFPQAMSAIRQGLAALGVLFDKLGQDKAAAVTQQAEELAKWVQENQKNAQSVQQWFITMFPDLQALLTYWNRLPDLVYVAHNIAASQKVSLHTALTAAQLAANEVKQNP